MKTAIDAVNELKGDLNNTHCYDPSQSFFLYYDASDDDTGRRWVSFLRHCDVLNATYAYIGDINEFLATVAECETNFGKCGRGEWLHYINASKLLLTKDLDKELDMGIDYIFNRDVVGSFTKDKSYMIKPNGNEFSAIDDEGDIHALSASFITAYFDRPAPTFTQEMADNGVLPSVGMKCLISIGQDPTWYEFTPDYFGSKYVVGYWKNREIESSLTIDTLKFYPLTPPIKLIDGKAYQFEARGNVFHGIYEKRAVSFNVMTGQFFNTVSCTNIQPLTVEVK